MGSLPPLTPTPWYESNLFFFGAGTTISVVLTVVAAIKHDLRWLLIVHVVNLELHENMGFACVP
jgi:hypothetical protein